MSPYNYPRHGRGGLPNLEDVAAARRIQQEREEMIRRAHVAGVYATRRAAFSEESFAERVGAMREAQQERGDEQAESDTIKADAEALQREQLRNLVRIAAKVAQAANADPQTAGEKVQLYRQEPKNTPSRKNTNARGEYIGEHKHVEDVSGWVLRKGSASINGNPGKPNLANKSGMGLVLTEDGRLFTYLEQKAPKTKTLGIGRAKVTMPSLERKDRTKLDRVTMLPKEHALVPDKTLLPRTAPQESRPTLLMALDDEANAYATPLVVEQSFDALAAFVQANDLEPPVPEAPTQQ